MQATQIPPKYNIPFAGGAGSTYVRPIPQASQIGLQLGAASLTDGFPPATFLDIANGGSWPWGADFNGILRQETQWSQWLSAGGPIRYDATFQTAIGGYPNGARVMSAATPGLYWYSLSDNNVTNPDAAGAGWSVPWFPDPASAAINIVGSGTNGANVLLSGNGTTTPNKTLRAVSGQFQIINSAYNRAILSLDDAGNLTASAGVIGQNLYISQNASISGSLTVGGPLTSGSMHSTGSLQIDGAATINGWLTAGDIVSTGGLFFSGNTSSGAYLQYQPSNGYWYFVQGNTVVGQFGPGGNFDAPASVTTGYLHTTGSAQIDGNQNINGSITAAWMHSTGSLQIDGTAIVNGNVEARGAVISDSGTFYANTGGGGYYLSRSTADGYWRFADNGNILATITTGGDINATASLHSYSGRIVSVGGQPSVGMFAGNAACSGFWVDSNGNLSFGGMDGAANPSVGWGYFDNGQNLHVNQRIFAGLDLEAGRYLVANAGATGTGNGNIGTILADFPFYISGNGYTRLPNGLIIQWGNVAANGPLYVNLPIAFPNLGLSCVISESAPSGTWGNNYPSVHGAQFSNNAQILTYNLQWQGNGWGSTNTAFFFIAIGF
jgi:cytoskeletal protein CcmA (bactofilin family)